MIQIGWLNLGFLEAIFDRMHRERSIMFFTSETLFLCGSNNLTINNQTSCRVMVTG